MDRSSAERPRKRRCTVFFESNTTDEGKESKKRNSEEGEENASLSRNVDSSLYLQFFSISPFFFKFFFIYFFFLSLRQRDVSVVSREWILIPRFFILLSTTIEKSNEIRLYSPYTFDYVTLLVRILFRSLKANRFWKKKENSTWNIE